MRSRYHAVQFATARFHASARRRSPAAVTQSPFLELVEVRRRPTPCRDGCRPGRLTLPERYRAVCRQRTTSRHFAKLPGWPKEGLCPRFSRRHLHCRPLDPCRILPLESAAERSLLPLAVPTMTDRIRYFPNDRPPKQESPRSRLTRIAPWLPCRRNRDPDAPVAASSLPRSTRPKLKGHTARGTRHGVIATKPRLLA